MRRTTGATSLTRVRSHYHCTRGLRAHRAPGIPCALCFRGAKRSGQTRAKSCGEIAKPCSVISPPSPPPAPCGGGGGGRGVYRLAPLAASLLRPPPPPPPPRRFAGGGEQPL